MVSQGAQQVARAAEQVAVGGGRRRGRQRQGAGAQRGQVPGSPGGGPSRSSSRGGSSARRGGTGEARARSPGWLHGGGGGGRRGEKGRGRAGRAQGGRAAGGGGGGRTMFGAPNSSDLRRAALHCPPQSPFGGYPGAAGPGRWAQGYPCAIWGNRAGYPRPAAPRGLGRRCAGPIARGAGGAGGGARREGLTRSHAQEGTQQQELHGVCTLGGDRRGEGPGWERRTGAVRGGIGGYEVFAGVERRWQG